MSTVAVAKCSACGGDHGSVEVRRDKGGEYFVCFDSDPRKLGVARRWGNAGRAIKSGARVAIERVALLNRC